MTFYYNTLSPDNDRYGEHDFGALDWAALYTISGGRTAPVAGGVLVLHEGQVIGAVGMSGDVSDNDEACAIAGVQKAGFEAEVGEAALGKQ